MFRLFKKKEVNSESYNKMFGEVTFPKFPYYKHPEKIQLLYLKILDLESEVFPNTKDCLTIVNFPDSYYSPEEIIRVMENKIKLILDNIYVKGNFISYSAGDKVIDTKNSKVEELQNGCLRVTSIARSKVIVKNYVNWKAEYKKVRKLSFEKIKQLKNLKAQVERLKKENEK